MKKSIITSVATSSVNNTNSKGRGKKIECAYCGAKKRENGNIYGKGYCLCNDCMKMFINF